MDHLVIKKIFLQMFEFLQASLHYLKSYLKKKQKKNIFKVALYNFKIKLNGSFNYHSIHESRSNIIVYD